MNVWEDVHAGDVVLGHDGQIWGVAAVVLGSPAGPIVTLTRHGVTTGPAQPPPGTPITILEHADSSAEARAFGVLSAAGLWPELIEERIAT